jgi:phosphinothricin acetyltransferase
MPAQARARKRTIDAARALDAKLGFAMGPPARYLRPRVEGASGRARRYRGSVGMTIEEAAQAAVRPISVRPSRDADVPAMLAIYLHHIRHGVDPRQAGDIETPDADDIKRRRKSMQRRKLPHIVAEQSGVVLGYAYAVPFRKRPAYRYAVKHSIYVHNAHLHRGIGRLLMTALIDSCAAAGFRQMIGYIDAANDASLAIHERFGFRRVGYLPQIGFKFGHWTDTVMVQRSLGLGPTAPPEA